MNIRSLKLIFVSLISLFLTGCATLSKPESVVLKSEKFGIPKAYEIDSSQFKSKFIYKFEFIIHSEPEGAEVWRHNELLGKTPLTIPVFIEFNYGHYLFSNLQDSLVIHPKWVSVFTKGGSLNWSFSATPGGFLIKKIDYYDYRINPNFEGNSGALAAWNALKNIFHGKSYEATYSLIETPEKFNEELSKLLKQKELGEAENLRQQRIAILKGLIEQKGLEEKYLSELKKLKEMGNLSEPEKAKPKEINEELEKLKADLDKAIKAGDYDRASKIKELIEYKEKSISKTEKQYDERAIKLNSEGGAYASSGYYNDALSSFKKAIEADPTYFPAYINASYCCIALRNLQEAIGYANNALKLKQDLPLAYFYLGVAYESQNQLKLAEKNYKKAQIECATSVCSDDLSVLIKKRLDELYAPKPQLQAQSSQDEALNKAWEDFVASLGLFLFSESLKKSK